MKRSMWAASVGGLLAATATAADAEVVWKAVGSPKASPPITRVRAEEMPVPAAPVPAPAAAPVPAPADSPAPLVVESSIATIAPPSEVSALQKPADELLAPPKPVPAPVTPFATKDATSAIIAPGSCCDAAQLAQDPQAFIVPMAVGTPQQFYVRGEFLGWWLKRGNGPVLLTTSTTPYRFTQLAPGAAAVNGADVGNLGTIGDPGTRVLLTASDLNDQFRTGGRFSAGWNFDPCGFRGIDASVFFTGRNSTRYNANTDQINDLYRPFSATGVFGGAVATFPARELVGTNALIRGDFAAETKSQFWGADINYRGCLSRGCFSAVDWFAGFRYLNLNEQLNITEVALYRQQVSFIGAGGAVLDTNPAGLRIDNRESFDTRNDFYGGQLGVNAEFRRDRWSLAVRPSIALGSTVHRLKVDGSFRESLNGVTAAQFVGGLLALDSNIRSETRNTFTYVPELNLRLGYSLTDNIRLSLGYDFLYWSSVIRPGDQIDTTLDIARVPPPGGVRVTPARPAPLFNTTDFWAQGVSAGVEYRW